MAKTVIIACSPSSGSTFLADLLDSSPFSVCGPELNIFSSRRLYNDFVAYKKKPSTSESHHSLYLRKNSLYKEHLKSYGLNYSDFHGMISKCDGPDQFIQRFRNSYFEFRGKSEATVQFEESPLNSSRIEEFLELNDNNECLFIVRNPIYVYLSVKKRGYTNYVALVNWLIEASAYYKVKEHPRVKLLKYEDLVESPYEVVSALICKYSGSVVEPSDVLERYKGNEYRKAHSTRLTKAWSVKSFGQVENANNKVLSVKDIGNLRSLYNLCVSEGYCAKYSLEPLSFVSALKEFSYYDDFIDKVSPLNDSGSIKKSSNDILWLMSKYFYDSFRSIKTLKYCKSYLAPVCRNQGVD